eukprot:11109923-Prorocentrum_lima.AAC.1
MPRGMAPASNQGHHIKCQLVVQSPPGPLQPDDCIKVARASSGVNQKLEPQMRELPPSVSTSSGTSVG